MSQFRSLARSPNAPLDWADAYPAAWDRASFYMPFALETVHPNTHPSPPETNPGATAPHQTTNIASFPNLHGSYCYPWNGNPHWGNLFAIGASSVVPRDLPGAPGHDDCELMPPAVAPAVDVHQSYLHDWAFGGLQAQAPIPHACHVRSETSGLSASEAALKNSDVDADGATEHACRPNTEHTSALAPHTRDLPKSTPRLISNRRPSSAHAAPDAETSRIPGPPDHQPIGALDEGLYNWLLAVLYPRRRLNRKAEPTPSGRCRLCTTICRRPGSLQQHVQIIHRQRIARKFNNKQPHSRELAFAFVVAHLQASPCGIDGALRQESEQYLDCLRTCPPSGLVLADSDGFPNLERVLSDVISGNGWLGAKCERCSLWLTKTSGLREHRNSCAG